MNETKTNKQTNKKKHQKEEKEAVPDGMQITYGNSIYLLEA